MKHDRKPCSLRRLLRRREGMTLTEVLVAFVVLMVLVGMFAGVVQLTSRVIARAAAQRQATADALAAFYAGSLTETPEAGEALGTTFRLTDGTAEIRLPLTVYAYRPVGDGRTVYYFGQHTLVTPPAAGG